MATALVTGAAGGIGARLLPALRAGGWTTRALVHEHSVEGADESVAGDLRDPGSLRRACEGIDAVVHLAAVTHSRHPRGYFEVNATGTRTLLEAVPGDLGRFVHVSTRAISPTGGAYSRSKREAEEAVRAAGVRFVIVRLPEVFGGGSREGVDDIVSRARRGAPIFVVGRGRQELCPLHVDDVVPVLVAALSAPTALGKTYTLAGDCLPAAELARWCSRTLGSGSRVVPVPLAVVHTLAFAARLLPLPIYPDQPARLEAPKAAPTPEARDDLGFRPRPLDRAFAEAPA